MNSTRLSTTQIAEICGVSQGTVDRALNNRKGISPKTKEKILNVAKEYGYRPNIHASSMAGGKSHLIGVVVFDLDNQYFSDVLTCIEASCTAEGYSTVVMFTNKDPKKEIECIRNLYHMAVDGMVLCPVNGGEEYENFLLSFNIPIVTIGNKLERIPYAGIDNALAIRKAVKSILHTGDRTLIYVKPEMSQRNTFAQTQRYSAFVTVCENEKVRYVITDLQNAEKEVAEHRPCVLVCPTDIYAIRLLPVAAKYGAGIIGFDNLRLIDELGLILDSVSYDVPLTAKVAVDHIVNGTPIGDFVPCQVVKRGSV